MRGTMDLLKKIAKSQQETISGQTDGTPPLFVPDARSLAV